MPLQVKHKFVSPKLDGPDATMVRPSNWNADHDIIGVGLVPAGAVIDFAGAAIPAGFLECYGQSVSAVTYATLFAAMVKQATVTLSLGTPGVVNWTNHGVPIYGKVRFRTTGTLPTGIVANTDYFVSPNAYSASGFRITATIGGGDIALSGTPTGTHTGVHAPFGAAADLTTFTIPDLRGRVVAGFDLMGGASGGRLNGTGGVPGYVLGGAGGTETHTLTVAEMPVHGHTNTPPNPTVNVTGLTVTVAAGGSHTHEDTLTIEGASIGAAGGHSHSIAGFTSTQTANHSHGQTGRQYGASYGGAGAHQHGHQGMFNWHNQMASGGAHRAPQDKASGGSSGAVAEADDVAGAHEHSVYVDLSGNTGIESATHAHGSGTLNAVAVADHTHPLTGGTIGGSITAAPAHTHTATVGGTATSTQAAYTSGNAGSGSGHVNVQPTLVLRKLIFTG